MKYEFYDNKRYLILWSCRNSGSEGSEWRDGWQFFIKGKLIKMGWLLVGVNVGNLGYSVWAATLLWGSGEVALEAMGGLLLGVHWVFSLGMNVYSRNEGGHEKPGLECLMVMSNCVALVLCALALILAQPDRMLDALPLALFCGLLHAATLVWACFAKSGYVPFGQCLRARVCGRCERVLDQREGGCCDATKKRCLSCVLAFLACEWCSCRRSRSKVRADDSLDASNVHVQQGFFRSGATPSPHPPPADTKRRIGGLLERALSAQVRPEEGQIEEILDGVASQLARHNSGNHADSPGSRGLRKGTVDRGTLLEVLEQSKSADDRLQVPRRTHSFFNLVKTKGQVESYKHKFVRAAQTSIGMLSEDMKGELKGRGICSICSDEMKAGDKITLVVGCQHSFHEECIATFLQQDPEVCPVCRCTAKALINILSS